MGEKLNQGEASRPLYQAIGWIRGELVPLEHDPTKYELLTAEGGDRLPIFGMKPQLRKWLETQDDRSGYWTIYPRTDRETGKLRLSISHKPQHEPAWEDGQFNFVGRVVFQDAEKGIIGIRIKRNLEPPPDSADRPEWKPFILSLRGFLPGRVVGQWWKLTCLRDGVHLEIVEGEKLNAPNPPLTKHKKGHSKPASYKTQKPKPLLKKKND
jgi:hypothetical protein